MGTEYRCSDRVRQLEEALDKKEEENDKLRSRIEHQQGVLAHRMQIIEKLQKERDELRKLNSDLVQKLAHVSRKNSVSSSGRPSPPVLLRRLTSYPNLPTEPFPGEDAPPTPPRRFSFTKSPTPPTSPPVSNSTKEEEEEEDSETDYSDMDEDTTDKSPPPSDASANESLFPKQKLSVEGNVSNLASISEERSTTPSPDLRGEAVTGSTRVPNGTVPKQVSPDDVFVSAPFKQDSVLSTASSTISSPGIASTTFEESVDMDSSLELTSPPFSPAKRYALKKGLSKTPPVRRILALADPRYKEISRSQESLNGTLDKDEVGEIGSGQGSTIRARTQTISALGKHFERGRRSGKERKTEETSQQMMDRQNSLRSVRRALLRDLELFSPDMEIKIHEKICRTIGAKYGGLPRATRAATSIQRAYREYTLRKRFEEIRKEASTMRKRAQSMSIKDPRRRPSILKKRPKYRREVSSPTTVSSTDPYAKVKAATKKLGQERASHTSSRLHLVQQKRSKQNLAELAAPASKPSEPDVEMESKVCQIMIEDKELQEPTKKIQFQLEGVCVDESSTDPDAEESDGTSVNLPTSFSSDELLTVGGYRRPVSIFSVQSAISLQEAMENELESSKGRKRALSVSAARRKTNIGVNHFNRKPTKGIQYLVLETVLEDSPKQVAGFLRNQYGLSKEKIGEFLGEINQEFNMAVLESLTETVDMQTRSIDTALREYQMIFRMPGEAQKIDRIMQAFALEYYKQNKDGPVKSEDAAYMLSFAIMMLHTALHNPSVRHRTTKKQWISMNRGCNEGDNFPEPFLLDIYDRIQKTEFTTGQDHTEVVIQIERSISGPNAPKLAIPQRRFVHRFQVSETVDLNSRPSFKNRHRRVVFIFSDLVIVCKKKSGDQFMYRDSFSLLNAISLTFETHHYKNGVQIYSSLDRKAIFQCNCDSRADRYLLIQKLEETIAELKEMEKERIAELGTSLGKTGHEVGGRRHRLESGAGDLLSSTNIGPVRTKPKEDESFVRGVGDIATTTLPAGYLTHRRTKSKGSVKENRSSKDSGFDSQQTTPVASPSPTDSTKQTTPVANPSPADSTKQTTPVTSPSPTESTRQTTPVASPSPTESTRQTTPVASPSPTDSTRSKSPTSIPITLLVPPTTPPPRSKSSDAIRSLIITPSPSLRTPPRSPSAENIGKRSNKKSKSAKDSKKSGDSHSRKSRFPSLSSPFRLQKDKTDRRNSHSPPTQRQRKDRAISPFTMSQ